MSNSINYAPGTSISADTVTVDSAVGHDDGVSAALLTAEGLTITGTQDGYSCLNLQPTWDENVSWTMIASSVVDTLSASASNLIDLNVNAAAKFVVRKDGRITSASDAIILGGYTLTVPATGTAALLGTAQTFTATKTFAGIDATSIGATTPGSGAFTTISGIQSTLGGTMLTLKTGAGNTDALTPLTISSVLNAGTYEAILNGGGSGGAVRIGNSSATAKARIVPSGNDVYFQNTSTGSVNFSGLDGSSASSINFVGTAATFSGTLAVTGSTGAGIAVSSTSFLAVAAGTTAKSSLNIATGAAPTSPVNGDIWFDGTDIKMRIGGVTKTFTLT